MHVPQGDPKLIGCTCGSCLLCLYYEVQAIATSYSTGFVFYYIFPTPIYTKFTSVIPDFSSKMPYLYTYYVAFVIVYMYINYYRYK